MVDEVVLCLWRNFHCGKFRTSNLHDVVTLASDALVLLCYQCQCCENVVLSSRILHHRVYYDKDGVEQNRQVMVVLGEIFLLLVPSSTSGFFGIL